MLPSKPRRGRMKLTAVTMIRNEADILPDFLGHCAALFDELLVVDHSSTDGTAEMLAVAAERMPVRIWRLGVRTMVQGLVVTALAREAVARGADWVFPLDADEFPLVPSRAGLEARLADAPPVLVWRWRNLWPSARAGFARFTLAGRHETLPRATPKIVVSRHRVAAGRFGIGHGSHHVLPYDPAAPEVHETLGELIHVPIRHASRFALKVAMNLAANQGRPNWRPGQGAQYDRAREKEALLNAPGGEAAMRRFALCYPGLPDREPRDAVETLDVAPLGRLDGLPAAPASPELVAERESLVRWQSPPTAEARHWRLRLEESEARLFARA